MNPLLILLALSIQSEVRVEIPATATVRGTSIRLNEIATITSTDADLARRLATFEVGFAPAPGYSRFLRREQLAADLKRHFPSIALTIAGEAGCRIEPLTEKIEAAQVEGVARHALLGLYTGHEAELALETSLVDLLIPQGESSPEVKAVLRDRRLDPGTRSVPVEIYVDRELYQTIWTSWRVDLWMEQTVLARNMHRGEVLTAAAFEVQRVKISSNPTDQPLDLSQSFGAVAKRDLAAGSLLTTADVEYPRVVSSGDLIRLDISRGAVKASTFVLAQQDGRIGERIRVLQPETGKELLATVRSREMVEIQMDR